MSVLATIAFLQYFVYSALALLDRKNLIHGNAEIASVVEMLYRTGGGGTLGLYFPFAKPYQIMQFGAYLHYRGVPVEGAGEEAAALNYGCFGHAGCRQVWALRKLGDGYVSSRYGARSRRFSDRAAG